MWPVDDILRFIENYRRESITWDVKHPLHRNRGAVTEAWERIHAAMNYEYTVDEMKKKKESLMTSYRNLVKRKAKEPSYEPVWFAFHALDSFLGEKYEKTEDIELDDDIEEEYLDEALLKCNDTEIDQPLAATPTYQIKKTRKRPKSPGKKVELIYLNTQKSYDPLVSESPSQYKNDSTREADEVDLYCSLLVKKLRKLDEHQRDIVMHEIDNLVYRVKMGKKSRIYISTSSPQQRIKSPAASDGEMNDMDDSYEHKHLMSDTNYKEINS